MTSTIDTAGRVVVPKAIREAGQLKPGTERDVRVVGGHIPPFSFPDFAGLSGPKTDQGGSTLVDEPWSNGRRDLDGRSVPEPRPISATSKT
ncbi:MAG: AbrB/MazE/SpoVT family DNA-binding domain-containing protein [Acidobacteriota bacterium]